jgi:O-antigen/teichoic acid export membrane protein
VLGDPWEGAGRYAQVLAPWFAVWLVSSPLSGLLTVREWQGSALAFGAFEFTLRLGALLVGIQRNSPMLAIVLLSLSGILISLLSIARFMHAGHSSILRVVGPAARLLALVIVCLLPAGFALASGSVPLAALGGAVGIVVYYVVVLRSEAASVILRRQTGAEAAPHASGAVS